MHTRTNITKTPQLIHDINHLHFLKLNVESIYTQDKMFVSFNRNQYEGSDSYF